MNEEPRRRDPHEGRATLDEIRSAPHAILADVEDIDAARALIEEMELNDVPPGAIELVGAVTKDSEREDEVDVPESRAFGDVAQSTILGGVVGMLVGALLGLVMVMVVPSLSTFWAIVMGLVFGGGIGGAAGGLSTVKYSSPAWQESYQVDETSSLRVAVHHADAHVVDSAQEVARRHVGDRVSRFDNA